MAMRSYILVILVLVSSASSLTEQEFFTSIGFDIEEFPYRQHWQSPSFDLWVSMDDTQTRLSILLENYVDGFVYHRFLSESDVSS